MGPACSLLSHIAILALALGARLGRVFTLDLHSSGFYIGTSVCKGANCDLASTDSNVVIRLGLQTAGWLRRFWLGSSSIQVWWLMITIVLLHVCWLVSDTLLLGRDVYTRLICLFNLN